MNGTATEFVFANAPEPWHALLVLLLAGGLAWFAWRRYGPGASGAAGVASRLCRAAAIALLVLMAAGPSWRTTTTTVLPGRVLIAVDRSASMARTDGPGNRARIAAATDLHAALVASPAAKRLVIDWQAIGGLAGPISDAELVKGLDATGAASPLADELARLVAERRPDGVILVSDGRVTAGSGLASLPAAWRGRDLATALLTAGGDGIEPELLIDEVVLNREVALDEREPVVVRLSCRALGEGPVKVTVTVEGEAPVQTEVAAPSGEPAAMLPAEARAELSFPREGAARVKVVAERTVGGRTLRAEQDVPVTVSERKLRVLLLAHRPRYEMRFLREAFKRDKTVTLHAYLAEGRWRRWGTGSAAEAGPDRLPLAPGELKDYDVVILGDLAPDALRETDLLALDKAVRQGGAGLVWMPGETGAIAGFATSKLGALLPVELPDAAAISRGYLAGEPRTLVRTPAAEALGLLDAGEVSWADLGNLLGAAPVTEVKPLAEVLAKDQKDRPLVVSRAYGSGRALFIGVDDTWRWRRNVGDRYLHRFHSQLMRYVAAGRRLGSHEWRLFTSPRRAASGETVALNLAPIGGGDNPPDAVTVRLKGPGGAERLVRLVREGKGFAARLPAPGPGGWELEIANGLDPRTVDSDQLLVLPPSDERRDPRADRIALGALASGTGGRVYDDAAKLVAELPDLSRSESVSALTGWWDTTWALAAAILLFAIDWSIRRLNRLP